MGDPRRVTNVVQQALWHRGLSRLDGIVLSHADADHINGVSGLIRTLPVKRLFVSPQFVDWRQPAVREVLNCVGHCGVPIRLIWQGDSWRLDNEVLCRVLHPRVEDKLANDNANSVVLSIEYAGRRLLLTGDLERDGLTRLLQTEPLHADVLLAPHHGSLGANTTDLARWAHPNWVAVSGDRRVSLATLRSRFGPSVDVLSTSEFGAITFEIDSSGHLTCDTFRRGRLSDDDDDIQSR
jgi:competence protein ComEC